MSGICETSFFKPICNWFKPAKPAPLSLGGCGAEEGEIGPQIESDGGIRITPDGGIAVQPDAFIAPDGGINIPITPVDGGPDGTEAKEPVVVTLTGDRFVEGVYSLEIPLTEEPGLTGPLKVVIILDPTLINSNLPCVDGLIRLTLNADGTYVSNPADPNSRPPLYVIGYRLSDLTGKVTTPVEQAVNYEDIKYLAASSICANGAVYSGNYDAVAFEIDIPTAFHEADDTLNAMLILTVITEPDKFVTGYEADYETRFVAIVGPRE